MPSFPGSQYTQPTSPTAGTSQSVMVNGQVNPVPHATKSKPVSFVEMISASETFNSLPTGLGEY